jgi:hypothetical protein
LGGVGPTEEVAIGLRVQVYLPFCFLFGYQRENRMVLTGFCEFNLAHLSKVSKTFNYVSMTAVN